MYQLEWAFGGKPVLDPDDMERIRVKYQARFILNYRRFSVNEISN